MRRRQKARPAVTLDRIQRLNRLIPYRISESVVARSDKLAIAVLRLFFGQDWIDQHVNGSAKSKFLTCVESPEQDRERQRMRRVILAEMLFNLQKVDGFQGVRSKMQEGYIEPTYGALEIARMIVTTATDTKLGFGLYQNREFSDGIMTCLSSFRMEYQSVLRLNAKWKKPRSR